ncbi:MAG: hypothetical protein ACRDRY_18835 [Pseudonocardiaceae bacterium]
MQSAEGSTQGFLRIRITDAFTNRPLSGNLAAVWLRTGLQASARTGLATTAVHGDRVHLTGHAITVLNSTLHHTAG